MEAIELLERVFSSLSREDLEDIARLVRVNTYPPDTVLCHEGEYESVFYLISKGDVVISKKMNFTVKLDSHEGQDYVLRHSGPGDFFGEMAIIQDAPRSATVTTTEETTVLELDKEVLVKTLQKNAPLALAMVRTTFDRLRANDLTAINELRENYETLELLDKAKLDFIQVAAHELRTPLTVMRGYASILLNDPTIRNNPVLREITEGIDNGSQRLHEIVNNMLDVQRIDMAELKIASVPVSLPVVFRGLEHDFHEVMEVRHLAFEMDIPADADVTYIEADPGLVGKSLYHILMNAIKYTPDGGSVRLSLAYEADPELDWVAHIQIADTGIGIAKENQKLIFEKFYRLGDVALHSSGKTAFKAGGPGLGLAIARGAIQAHGGKLWVESPGYDEKAFPGSTFHIVLPIRTRKQPLPSAK